MYDFFEIVISAFQQSRFLGRYKPEISRRLQAIKTTSNKYHAIHFFALDEPWPYLVILCYLVTMSLVWVGNPMLPFELLASEGWAWHHIPEILAFLFFGIYLANLGYLSSENLNYLDSATLILLTVVALTYAALISYNEMFRIVLAIVFVPSFSGYFVTRFHNIHKTTANLATP